VAVLNAGSSDVPNLLVTNSDGKVATLQGIGSDGKGNGFFQPSTSTLDLGQTIVQSLSTSGGQFFVDGDGSISELAGSSFVTLLGDEGATALAESAEGLVAGFKDGDVGLVLGNGTVLLLSPTGFMDAVSGLAVLPTGEVVATERGNDSPVLLSFAFVPVLTEAGQVLELPALLRSAPVAETISQAGADLVLVGTLLSGSLMEQPPPSTTTNLPSESAFGLFIAAGSGETVVVAPGGLFNEADVQAAVRPPVSGWESFAVGAAEALRLRVQRQQLQDRLEEFFYRLDWLFPGLWESLRQPMGSPEPSQGQPWEPLPPLSAMMFNLPDGALPDAFLELNISADLPALEIQTPAGDSAVGTGQNASEPRALLDWKVALALCLALPVVKNVCVDGPRRVHSSLLPGSTPRRTTTKRL
jgi:hypothetical protein